MTIRSIGPLRVGCGDFIRSAVVAARATPSLARALWHCGIRATRLTAVWIYGAVVR